jgi:hypothetical protein
MNNTDQDLLICELQEQLRIALKCISSLSLRANGSAANDAGFSEYVSLMTSKCLKDLEQISDGFAT